MTQGAFITFEGGEASGKSTQLVRLAEKLRLQQYTVETTREPGGDEACERIRRLLLDHQWQPLSEVMLFAANRYEHSQNLVIPSVQQGKIVLCDRFMDSSTAYQGYGLGMPLELLKTLESYVVPLRPSLTFIIDIDVETAQLRLQKRGKTNHIDERPIAFHERVRRGYETIAKNEPHRCMLINGKDDEETIHQHILALTLDHLQTQGIAAS